ncbi:PREDICTED: uncharacterized protein LOC105454260 [Wasmannia auropunctata]|uniref:uncharacterized protein LOC105454260 n=1 Tax=Wasmannia auropunctata TaxID=64793 RepID=UPI0005EE62F9|nr:PREDICTED: uncharacterized protein LOC105454260 [Wasmannia auropunctata]
MGNFAITLLTGIVILRIVLGAHFHGHEYKQYHDNRVNGGQLPMTASYEVNTTRKSYYDNDIKEEVKSRFEDKDSFWNKRKKRNGNNSDNAELARCDKNQTFCEDVPNYPQELVNEILAKNPNLLHYAFDDIGVSPQFDEEDLLCLSRVEIVHPKLAMNIQNQWKYILQAENFRQGARIEICVEPETKCRLIDDIAEGYIASCKQNYIYLMFLAISGDQARPDYFKLYSNCCCHVEFNPTKKR